MSGATPGKTRLFRLTWPTLAWVVGLNVIPALIAYPFFGLAYGTAFWFIVILPYSICGSLSPLLRASFQDRLVLLGCLVLLAGLVFMFLIASFGVTSPATAIAILFFATVAVPVIDGANVALYRYPTFRDQNGKTMSDFFETDPTNW